LAVEQQGFKRYEQRNLQLLVNVPMTVNVILQVGSMSTEVQVSAQSETINNQVKQLPLESRNVPDLLSLQAVLSTREIARISTPAWIREAAP
jgi:hypothetical protein